MPKPDQSARASKNAGVDGNQGLSAKWLVEPPRYLYRYMPVSDSLREGFAEQLVRGQLHLSSVLNFNDPFDCLPDIRVPSKAAVGLRLKRDRRRVQGLGDDAVGDAQLKKFLKMGPEELRRYASQTFRQTIGDIGVACFSETAEDVLMWSHYANCHKGICVRFDTHVWPSGGPFSLLLQVAYGDLRPVFNFPSHPRVSRTNEMFEVLTTKARFWEPEREWRLLANGKAGQSLTLPAGLVDGVIIGAQAGSRVKDLVREWISPEQSLFAARIHEKTFGVSVNPMTR